MIDLAILGDLARICNLVPFNKVTYKAPLVVITTRVGMTVSGLLSSNYMKCTSMWNCYARSGFNLRAVKKLPTAFLLPVLAMQAIC